MNLAIGAKVNHPSFGEGVIFSETDSAWRIFFREHGEKELGKAYTGFTLLEASTVGVSTITLEDVVEAVQNVFDQYYDVSEIVELGDKWEGGTMILQPGDTSLKGKDLPIETFFHKIVMLRDRLRVLEQNINSHEKLSDEDKVHLQQYITRIYGTLTTFNVLFKSKNDYFVGESTKG
ncbi:MAG: hypothetical protein RL226_2322 [Bacteroidota bacterium]|jgi:hypothetical protein